MTNLINVETPIKAKSMLTRLIDFLKVEPTTGLFTSLASTERILVGLDLRPHRTGKEL